MKTEAEYKRFLENIDNSVAGEDEFGNLTWHVECTSETNAGDTCREEGLTFEDNAYNSRYWEMALATATGAADAWQDYYPQLIKD